MTLTSELQAKNSNGAVVVFFPPFSVLLPTFWTTSVPSSRTGGLAAEAACSASFWLIEVFRELCFVRFCFFCRGFVGFPAGCLTIFYLLILYQYTFFLFENEKKSPLILFLSSAPLAPHPRLRLARQPNPGHVLWEGVWTPFCVSCLCSRAGFSTPHPRQHPGQSKFTDEIRRNRFQFSRNKL